MTTAEAERQSPHVRDSGPGLRTHMASAAGRVSGAIQIARTGAARLVVRLPGTMNAARAGAREATSALQRLPDPTLRWLAASSVGLAAGFQLAGAPRLVRAAGVAPALLMGAAIVLRPTEPVARADQGADTPTGGITDMTDEHARGSISTVQGKVEEGLGKLTGDKERQAHGKAKQVQGAAQKSLGDIQDAIRAPKGKA